MPFILCSKSQFLCLCRAPGAWAEMQACPCPFLSQVTSPPWGPSLWGDAADSRTAVGLCWAPGVANPDQVLLCPQDCTLSHFYQPKMWDSLYDPYPPCCLSIHLSLQQEEALSTLSWHAMLDTEDALNALNPREVKNSRGWKPKPDNLATVAGACSEPALHAGGHGFGLHLHFPPGAVQTNTP